MEEGKRIVEWCKDCKFFDTSNDKLPEGEGECILGSWELGTRHHYLTDGCPSFEFKEPEGAE